MRVTETDNGGVGHIKIVAPFRIDTGALGLGKMPGQMIIEFEIVPVPEPGVALLLIAGAFGLAVIGRSRMG
jgi:hypothetical protein